jgi:hypothetical protein
MRVPKRAECIPCSSKEQVVIHPPIVQAMDSTGEAP